MLMLQDGSAVAGGFQWLLNIGCIMPRTTPTRSLLALLLLSTLLLNTSACTREVIVDAAGWDRLEAYQHDQRASVELGDGEVVVVEAKHKPNVHVLLKDGDTRYTAALDQLAVSGDSIVLEDAHLERSRLIAALNPTGRTVLGKDEIDSLSVELSGYAPPDWEPTLAVGLSAGGPALFASLDLTWFATEHVLVDFGLGNLFGPTGAASPYAGLRWSLWGETFRPFLGAVAVEHFFFGAVDDTDRSSMNEADYAADAVTTVVPRLGLDAHLYNGRVIVGAEVDLNLVVASTLDRDEEGFLLRRDHLNPWGGMRAQVVW